MKTRIVAGITIVGLVTAGLTWALAPAASAAVANACRPFSDYNGDGFGDLAIGVPRRDVAGKANAGNAVVMFGASFGMSRHDRVLHQNSTGIADTAERGDLFGWAVSSGDFNGDDKTDLAVGVPGENASRGIVQEFHGRNGVDPGFRTNDDEIWHLRRAAGSRTSGDQFGRALASGDFDGDGVDDLAVGVPGRHMAKGVVVVFYGDAGTGLTEAGADVFTEANLGGTRAEGDRFGSVLLACDFDGDDVDDLAIGSPLDDVSGVTNAGSVGILYGDAGNGLTAAGAQRLVQGSSGLQGTPQAHDRFGWSLAGGDIDGNTFNDLAVGVERQNAPGAANAGLVHVLYSTGVGVQAAAPDDFELRQDAIGGDLKPDDRFGSALAIADFNLDGFADIAVGVPLEDHPSPDNTGEVDIVFGSNSGVDVTARQRLDQASLIGGEEKNDKFGAVLAASDFGGEKFMGQRVPDLAIGVIGEDITTLSGNVKRNTGTVQLVFGTAGVGAPAPVKLLYGDSGVTGTPKTGDQFGFSLA